MISIRLQDKAVAECEHQAGRPLLDAERYAIAKMTLFEAFDGGKAEEPNYVVEPDAPAMVQSLRTLGRIV